MQQMLWVQVTITLEFDASKLDASPVKPLPYACKAGMYLPTLEKLAIYVMSVKNRVNPVCPSTICQH